MHRRRHARCSNCAILHAAGKRQELTHTTLPACSDGVQHLIEQNNLDSRHDSMDSCKDYTNCAKLSANSSTLRALKARHGCAHPGPPGLAWTGGGYPAMVDVRAHYIGLGAIDAACLRLSCVMTKTPCSAAVLPPSVHVWQVQQLWANNEHNNIALSESAYQHNIALAKEMAATALPHASDLASGAPAALAAVAMMGIEPDCQLASSVCASSVPPMTRRQCAGGARAGRTPGQGGSTCSLPTARSRQLRPAQSPHHPATAPPHRQRDAGCSGKFTFEPALDPATLAHSRKMRECAALRSCICLALRSSPLHARHCSPPSHSRRELARFSWVRHGCCMR